MKRFLGGIVAAVLALLGFLMMGRKRPTKTAEHIEKGADHIEDTIDVRRKAARERVKADAELERTLAEEDSARDLADMHDAVRHGNTSKVREKLLAKLRRISRRHNGRGPDSGAGG